MDTKKELLCCELAASAFTTNDIEVAANLAEVMNPYDEVKTIARILNNIIDESLKQGWEVLDGEEFYDWKDRIQGLQNLLENDWWLSDPDDVHSELHHLVWRWALDPKVHVLKKVAVEYWRLQGIAIHLKDKGIGYEKFIESLIPNLYHKISFWVFQVPEIENDEMAEELLGASHIAYYARLSQEDKEKEFRKFNRKKVLEFATFEKFCQATGVGKQAENILSSVRDRGWFDVDDWDKQRKDDLEQVLLHRENEMQDALWSKAVQNETGKKPRPRGGVGLDTKKGPFVVPNKNAKANPELKSNGNPVVVYPEPVHRDSTDIDADYINKVSDWGMTAVRQQIIFYQDDLHPTPLDKERLEYLIQEYKWRKEVEEIKDKEDKKPIHELKAQTTVVQQDFTYDVSRFPKKDIKENLRKFKLLIRSWSEKLIHKHIRIISVEKVVEPWNEKAIDIHREFLTETEDKQLQMLYDELARRDASARDKAHSQMVTVNTADLEKELREKSGAVYVEVKSKAKRSDYDFTIDEAPKKLVSKWTDSEEELGTFEDFKAGLEGEESPQPAKGEKKKALEPSSDIVSKVTNCLDQIRDYHAKRKGSAQPLRASHIAQFIKCNMTAEAPTLWTRIARENKETDNPEASKLKHKEAVYNRELKKPEDYLKGKTVPLSEAKRKADEWNSKREIKEEECWVEGPYKAHDILHPDVQAFIRAHFELGDSQKAKYKNGDEFEYYFPHGHSSAQVKVKPLVEDLCRLVDLGKEVDDWERYYKKTWADKEIKSKKQEKKDAAAKA